MKFIHSTVLLSIVLAGPALAQQKVDEHSSHHVTAATSADMADGEVRKVDKDASKVTLKHGEIKSLEMPAMTMVFVVKDKAMLDSIQPGDKVRFKATNDAGKFTVTEMQVVR
ncbi:MAG: copper-binding protein [Vitreoscilla sp.]|nr:copper-binding protein [Vitreoscilla sp.]